MVEARMTSTDMKKIIFVAIMAGLTAQSVLAQTTTPATDTQLADKFFNKNNPALTKQEKAGLDIAKNWNAKNANASRPIAGPNGAVVFVFGESEPSIVCAVMQICDVSLQRGEQVTSVSLGDSVRWLVEPAISGSGAYATQHLIIKPLDVGLDTSLVITTNLRTYHIRLRSHRTEFMPTVSFTYPEDSAAKWAALKRAQEQERQANTIPETGEYLGELDFNYQVSGSAPWKPVRVYNDGKKTIIEMPKTMAQTEAPTLLSLLDSGSAFKKDQQVMLNYRLQGNRYIVDAVFDKAMLIAGVGSAQKKILIERSKK
jgi:P-type conjugative transfer protein TrbG